MGDALPFALKTYESLLAAEWERISGGTVSLKNYPGGVAGDEPDIIGKMRIGTLNAALIRILLGVQD